MKKFISVLLIIAMMFVVIPTPFATTKSANGDAMINFAISQLGTTGEEYALLGVSFEWCAWFVTFCAYNVGLCSSPDDFTSSIFPPYERPTWSECNWAATGVTYQINYFTQNSKGVLYKFGKDSRIVNNVNVVAGERQNYIPQTGDLIYFDNDVSGSWDHVAIVYKYNEDSDEIIYIGGNQGESDFYSERCVSQRQMKRTNDIYVGFLHPDYENALAVDINDPENYEIPQREIYVTSPLMKGTDVGWVQAVLKKLGYDVDIDCMYGPASEKAVKQFQIDNGIAPDGRVGDFTLDKLIELWNNQQKTENVSAKYVIISDTGVSMRKGHGTKYDVLCRIPCETKVFVTVITADKYDGHIWAKTVYEGKTGWFAFDYAKLTDSDDTSVIFDVTFKDIDGTVLKKEEVVKGMSATPPEVTDKEGLVFAGWDGDFSCVMCDMILTAKYVMVGDVTVDGQINTGDAVFVLRYAAGSMDFSEISMKAADITCDGEVNTGDAVAILRYSAGTH